MKYSIDTSALMDGWDRYYPRDVHVGLWRKLEELIEAGDVISTEFVLKELEKKHDDLFKWAKERKAMFRSANEQTQLAVREILRDHQHLINAQRNRSGADPWVIALARVEGCKVLTGERKAPAGTNPPKLKMPNFCEALGVEWVDMVKLCREQKWTFDIQ